MSSAYKPANALTVTCKVSGAYVYLYPHPTLPMVCAMGFAKKASKPAFRYRFSTEAQRAAYAANFLSNSAARATAKAAERAARKATGHSLAVGDILSNSWGYEQTNVDFYQVTRVTGSGVYLRPIYGTQYEDNGLAMHGRVVASPGNFKGDEFFKRARGDSVSMAHGWCGKWDGRPMHYSSYH